MHGLRHARRLPQTAVLAANKPPQAVAVGQHILQLSTRVLCLRIHIIKTVHQPRHVSGVNVTAATKLGTHSLVLSSTLGHGLNGRALTRRGARVVTFTVQVHGAQFKSRQGPV